MGDRESLPGGGRAWRRHDLQTRARESQESVGRGEAATWSVKVERSEASAGAGRLAGLSTYERRRRRGRDHQTATDNQRTASGREWSATCRQHARNHALSCATSTGVASCSPSSLLFLPEGE